MSHCTEGYSDNNRDPGDVAVLVRKLKMIQEFLYRSDLPKEVEVCERAISTIEETERLKRLLAAAAKELPQCSGPVHERIVVYRKAHAEQIEELKADLANRDAQVVELRERCKDLDQLRVDANWEWSKEFEKMKKWKDAVVEACIVNCIGWDENDPKKTVHDLCAYEAQIALDPAVSEEARKLRDTYKPEE